jgi:AraC-like DNA-binding protein
MRRTPDRSRLALPFQPALPGRLGEVTMAALYWDRGGTPSLERYRRMTDLHLLVFCLEGRSDYADERGVRRSLLPGDLVLLPRGLAHSYRPTPGHGWSEIHAWLRGPLPDLWWQTEFLGPGLTVLRADPVATAARQLCRLLAAPNNDERLGALQAWLARLSVRGRRGPDPRAGAAPWFSPACRALARGTLRQPELPALARQSGVSYETFRKVFSRLAGASPGQYRLAAVIQNACAQLRDPTLTIKAIAARFEFADEFHFARTFRQRMGLSPSQYRRLGTGTP